MEYKISLMGNLIGINEDGKVILINTDSKEYSNYIKYLENKGIVEFSDILSDDECEIIKNDKIKELDELQYNELKKTDWYYIRKIETGIAIPEDIITERLNIRNHFNNLKNNL